MIRAFKFWNRFAVLVLLQAGCAEAADFAARFQQIRQSASPAQMYALLFALPKGGDLHHHNGLAIHASVWYSAATSPKTLARNRFYTLTEFHNCDGFPDATPRYVTVQQSTWSHMGDCARKQFEPLEGLSADRKAAWISALILDKPNEGRDEFFGPIVARLGDLLRDPYLLGDAIVENMKLFGAEGVRYIESQWIPGGLQVDGSALAPEESNRIVLERLQQSDAMATGVALRFQWVVIRFRPDAEKQLDDAYAWVLSHRAQWVGINMAGREDNDKGYALRFLPEVSQTTAHLQRRAAIYSCRGKGQSGA